MIRMRLRDGLEIVNAGGCEQLAANLLVVVPRRIERELRGILGALPSMLCDAHTAAGNSDGPADRRARTIGERDGDLLLPADNHRPLSEALAHAALRMRPDPNAPCTHAGGDIPLQIHFHELAFTRRRDRRSFT